MRTRRAALFSIATLALVAATQPLLAGCTVRPPPIKSSPTLTDPSGPPECTWIDGIDPAGNPACSDGCTWDAPQKKCAPVAPAPKPRVPPNGA